MATGVMQVTMQQLEPAAEIMQKLEMLRRRTTETGNDLRQLEQELEAYALQYHECTKVIGIVFYCYNNILKYWQLIIRL